MALTNTKTDATRVFLEGLSKIPDSWRQLVSYRTDDVSSLKLAALTGVQDPGVWTSGDMPVPGGGADPGTVAAGYPDAPGSQKTLAYDAYALSLKLNKYDTKDVPQLANYTAQKLGMAVAHKYASLAYTTLIGAHTTNLLGIQATAAPTGKVIAGDHPCADGVTTRSNRLTSELDSDALMVAIALMRNWKNFQGQYMALWDGPIYLVIPPALERLALEATRSPLSGSDMQVNSAALFNIQIVVSPFLSDLDDWYLISGMESPVVYWERSSPMFSIDVDQDSRQTKISCDFAVKCDWGVTPDGIFASSVTA